MTDTLTDTQKQALLDKMCAEGIQDIPTMPEDTFIGLIDALRRMYASRILNCCDASGKNDKEWGTLSAIFARIYQERVKEEKE